jgi:hypothetical protein
MMTAYVISHSEVLHPDAVSPRLVVAGSVHARMLCEEVAGCGLDWQKSMGASTTTWKAAGHDKVQYVVTAVPDER